SYDFESLLNHLKEIQPKKYNKIMYLDNNIDKISFLLALKKDLIPSKMKILNSKILKDLKIKLDTDSVFEDILNFFKECKDSLIRLDEIISTEINRKNLAMIDSDLEKKEYINNIYKNYDSKNFVKKSYLENYDLDENNFHWNVSYLDGNEYKGKVDLFVGGSPCQSFSIAGKRKGLEDTRGTLFYEFIRLVKEIEPRFFIYENVKGLLNHDNKNTWKIVKECFDELGYYYDDKILNARNFGIPQNRERVFVIGFKNREDFERFSMEEKIDLKHYLKDFLLDNNNIFLPKENINFINYEDKKKHQNLSHLSFENWMDPLLLKDSEKKFVTSEEKQKKKYTQINGDVMLTQRACQQYNLHGDFVEYGINKYFLSNKVKDYILDTTTSFNVKDIQKHINCDIAKALVATSAKMHRASIDNYISYGNEIPLSNRKIRKLHPRECLRLMGFCDSFKIVVSDTQIYHQSGNSIVVDVLIQILNGIFKL
ncbi:MAG: DNA cytosine methyltransferase, partial [Fusobacteriaceae bacterium]